MNSIFLICVQLALVQYCICREILRSTLEGENIGEENPDLDEYNLPGEPFNPADFEAVKHIGENKRSHGSEVYYKESLNVNSYTRNGLVASHFKWPKVGNYVIIPYVISTRFEGEKRMFILKAFEDFHKSTCVRFIPRVNQKDYIYIVYGEGCDSDAGRVGGEQTVSLGKDCDWVDIAIHELNHAVGFWHEQNRPDRDAYIHVYLDNVIPENRFNFDKMKSSEVHSFGQKYDTDSIMHYDKWAFSKSYGKLVVMRPKTPNENMGLAKVLSKTDITKINLMYKCPKPDKMRPATVRDPEIPWDQFDICQNLHTNCTTFASFKSTCDTNVWVKVNCRKACGKCGDMCEDTHTHCDTWAEEGACEEHPEYMGMYCRKSCLKC